MTDLTPEALDALIADYRAPMLDQIRSNHITAQMQKRSLEKFDAIVAALRAQLATALKGLEYVKNSHKGQCTDTYGVVAMARETLALIDTPAPSPWEIAVEELLPPNSTPAPSAPSSDDVDLRDAASDPATRAAILAKAEGGE